MPKCVPESFTNSAEGREICQRCDLYDCVGITNRECLLCREYNGEDRIRYNTAVLSIVGVIKIYSKIDGFCFMISFQSPLTIQRPGATRSEVNQSFGKYHE